MIPYCGHDQVDQLLDKSLHGELDSQARRSLEQHVAQCTRCAELYGVLTSAARAWRAEPDLEIPAGQQAAVEYQLAEAILAKGPWRRAERPQRIWAFVLGGALAAAAVLTLVLVWQGPEPKQGPNLPVAQRDLPTVTTPPARATAASEVLWLASLRAGRASMSRGAGLPQPVGVSSVLHSGDVLALEDRSRVDFSFRNGIAVLSERAVAALFEQQGQLVIELRRGLLTSRVVPVGGPVELAILTPAGRVEITGTTFQVRVFTTAEVHVEVVEGTVVVRDPANERNIMSVNAGQWIALDWDRLETNSLEESRRKEILETLGAESPAPPPVRGQVGRKVSASATADDWQAQFDEAERLRRERKWNDAAEIYEKISKQARTKTERAEAAFALGQMFFSQGELNRAEAVLARNRALFRDTPYDELALYYLGKTRLELGRYAAAVESFQALHAAHPNGGKANEARLLSAEVLAKQLGNCSLALSELEPLLRGETSGSLKNRAQAIAAGCANAEP